MKKIKDNLWLVIPITFVAIPIIVLLINFLFSFQFIILLTLLVVFGIPAFCWIVVTTESRNDWHSQPIWLQRLINHKILGSIVLFISFLLVILMIIFFQLPQEGHF